MEREPIVWIVDSEQWPRAFLRAELIERGYDAVGYETLSEAIIALHLPDGEKPQVIVLELRDQQLRQGALEMLERAEIPIIVLGGAIELNEEIIKGRKWASVMKRPFTLGAVVDKVEEIIPAK